MMRAVILYMPVLHKGYLRFFDSLVGIDEIFVINSELALVLQPSLRKDIRALHSEEMVAILSDSNLAPCKVSELIDLNQLNDFGSFVMPKDEISRQFSIKYLPGRRIDYIGVFLRWDKKNISQNNEVIESFNITKKEFDRKIMSACSLEAPRSADWWRQVGGCIVKNGSVILPPIHNEHVPNALQPYYDGDPRTESSKGANIEIGTALHVELSLISTAAEVGLSLSGAQLYVSTFPCPWCAKAIAYSGIEQVYFEEGYSVLDAQSILEANGVQIVRVIK